MVYAQAQKTRYRITLELEVLNDFNPRDINWEKLSVVMNLRGHILKT